MNNENLNKNFNESIIKSKMKNTNEVIMNILPNVDKAIIPVEKFTKYTLNPDRQPNKSQAFDLALGYNLDNVEELIEAIYYNISKFPMKSKGQNEYGNLYEVIMPLIGPNGKQANVLTAWIIENGTDFPRLTNAYVTKKKRGVENGT